eukprot:8844445-Karenia_brevis.AAC.1
MWWIRLECGSRWTRVPMSVGADGVKSLNSSGIGCIMPPPAGDPMAVRQSVPLSSHVGPSGYATNSQGTMAA